jgi:CubicO group peptidase (beta-lactamase class C family)
MRILLVLLLLTPSVSAQTYWPAAEGSGVWERRTAAQAGMNAAKLDAALAFAKASETKESRDLEEAHYAGAFGREPFSEVAGPLARRGDPTGIILRHGYIVAEWGDPQRVDMTFSVAKSFLSTVVGMAVDQKLIGSTNDRVADTVGPIILDDGTIFEPFASAHAKTITWEHLLRQTSDWSGTLWGKPDWADRPAQDLTAERARPRNDPGAVWEYNDTRVNLLALCAMSIWRRPLPQILHERVMEPIGASRTWRWLGYHNSWILLDGVRAQSVSGGSHWGGGLMINARDQARFGLLTLRNGKWRDRQIVSEAWLRAARTPTAVKSDYGYMNFYLNTNRALFPSAPADAFAHLGAGQNVIYVDPGNDLVIVARWIDGKAMDGLVARVVAALE